MWAPGPWSVQLAWVILTVTEVSYTLRYPVPGKFLSLDLKVGRGWGELVTSLHYMCPIDTSKSCLCFSCCSSMNGVLYHAVMGEGYPLAI